ncbi:N-succinyldiaminopimelate aminotransferase [Methylohalomonas lacus]|uniref:N-succinyldiaminopimelate aminotransferase n=1 Tax=Methylohalomonas lacus TaxID=398773 RepID=A0AAE3HM82_9GAMM|nr:succinyldiaminopimelate transaminase [Methylohalomonas lacus]MCS3903734.1 N-succinyldiaminopimelate aminotransferase [Methylohalomonas lacus]
MNKGLEHLQPYPFEKLAQLFADVTPAAERTPIDLSIGEPKHPTPSLIRAALGSHLEDAGRYPTTRGIAELRIAISDWLTRRFKLSPGSIDPEQHVIPVNGTREALFAIAQCLVDGTAKDAKVLMPNPFYQIYEGAALLAGAEPQYLNCTQASGFLPDLDSVTATDWQRCQLLYLCSPGNPAGAVIPQATYERLFALADEHDFVIAADECYSEIYPDEAVPPLGILEAAARHGRDDYRRLLAFHSLSKRSNAPGMRSGFVGGDAELIRQFLRYRTYHGCAMAPYAQMASIAAWNDESHVLENRNFYREKFDRALEILQPVMEVERPAGGFYLWPKTPVSDTEFAHELKRRENVTVLPGSYLSRETGGINPGENRVRIALVAPVDNCVEAAQRIRNLVQSLS